MPRISIIVEDTPNPQARMYVVSRPLSPEARRSYVAPEQARGDPLAEQLFAVPHVVGVMILNDFCTITKAPRGQWRQITPEIKAVLTQAANAAP